MRAWHVAHCIQIRYITFATIAVTSMERIPLNDSTLGIKNGRIKMGYRRQAHTFIRLRVWTSYSGWGVARFSIVYDSRPLNPPNRHLWCNRHVVRFNWPFIWCPRVTRHFRRKSWNIDFESIVFSFNVMKSYLGIIVISMFQIRSKVQCTWGSIQSK
jgi:hypothetical protein